MIVDDNEIDIFINKKVLEFSDFCSDTICMKSASDALDFLKDGNDLPELILLDLNMPVIDGFRFLYEFSKLPEDTRSRIKIVVLTSSNNARDKEKVAANPYVLEYVSKPLNEQKLQRITDNFFSAQPVVGVD